MYCPLTSLNSYIHKLQRSPFIAALLLNEAKAKALGLVAQHLDIVLVEATLQQRTTQLQHTCVSLHIAQQYVAVDVGKNDVEAFVGGQQRSISK